ncbi:hypothetical protein Bpfe_023794 [Biomphalaria pfeifferi]|uniref:Uncharacterized protein n=1 Tax=Biomphalaria pfeifferi TaxID=112525 RepID=A0AAD8B4Z5_BIOPF|nr:hypothetical protein Bpfe_023794 [Biomphalaria pfeifferi]
MSDVYITDEHTQIIPNIDYSATYGHQKHVPVNDFSLEDLPVCYQHAEMFDLIRSLADLTVKIEVKGVGKRRKQYWSAAQRTCVVKDLGKGEVMFGSGKVDDVFFRTEKDGQCPCDECLICPKKEWGEIRILTSAQLLYDDEDAKHFSCTLFYDDDQQIDVRYIRGHRVVVRNVERDLLMFMCSTCDLDLIRKLEGMLDRFEACWENAFDKYVHTVQWDSERLVVIVSHPYGGKKHVSLGKKSYGIEVKPSKGINYDTPTYQGSAGTFVLIPDFDVKDDIVPKIC